VVFPDAPLRIYLDAAPHVRARRRAEQLRASGRPASELEILQGILERDRIDSGRSEGPLRVPVGAECVDTSELDLDGVVERLEALARVRLGERLAVPAAASRP
jgi:cytidylate kinase